MGRPMPSIGIEKALRLGAADLSEKRIRKRLQDLTFEKFSKMKDLINLVLSREDLNAKDGKQIRLGSSKTRKTTSRRRLGLS